MRNTKRFLSVLLAMVMLVAVVPMGVIESGAAYSMTWNDYYSKVQSFIGDSRWSNGTSWGGSQGPKLSSWSSSGCCAYAADFTKYVFGAPSQRSGDVFYSAADIRAGDVLYLSPEHWVAVLSRSDSVLYTAEGNCSGRVLVSNTVYRVNGNSFSGSGKSFVYGYHYLNIYVDLGSDFYAYIVKYNTWKYLEASSEITQTQQTAEHCNVQIAKNGNDESDPRQIWHFIRQGNGSYKIQNAYDDGCMDVYGANTDNYTNVITTKDDHGRENQRWIINDNPSWNSSRLVPQHALNKSLDVSGDSSNPGANVAIHDQNDSPAQGFSIYKINAYSKPAKPVASTVSVKTLGQPNKTTTLSWTASALKDSKFDNRTYTLTLTKDGAAYQTKTGLTGMSINLTLPKGTYTAKIRAVNTKYYNYYTDGNTITFTVKDCTHTWNAGAVTTSASCTESGVKTYTCTSCGATRTETINKLGHTNPDANGNCTRCGTHLQDVTPSDPGTTESVCPWCGGTHEGMFGWLVQVFHNIFAAIFGARY